MCVSVRSPPISNVLFLLNFAQFVKRRWNTILPRFEGAHRAHWKAISRWQSILSFTRCFQPLNSHSVKRSRIFDFNLSSLFPCLSRIQNRYIWENSGIIIFLKYFLEDSLMMESQSRPTPRSSVLFKDKSGEKLTKRMLVNEGLGRWETIDI